MKLMELKVSVSLKKGQATDNACTCISSFPFLGTKANSADPGGC